MPPQRPRFGCIIEAAFESRSVENSLTVVSLSPVATGIDVPAATLAIPLTSSGGTGSSNQRGSYFSKTLASLSAPEGVNCPWVPNNMSAPVPRVSRRALTIDSQNSNSLGVG